MRQTRTIRPKAAPALRRGGSATCRTNSPLCFRRCAPPEGDGASAPQDKVRYAASAMLLDADNPHRLLARSAVPLLEPTLEGETDGVVPNVVFPTAIEQIGGIHYVFCGMADSRIGLARLDRKEANV
jgi:hypothetical protein